MGWDGGFPVLLEISPGERLGHGEICAYLQFTCACARAEPGLLSAATARGWKARRGQWESLSVCS